MCLISLFTALTLGLAEAMLNAATMDFFWQILWFPFRGFSFSKFSHGFSGCKSLQKVSLPTSKGVGFSGCFIFSRRCITAQQSQPHIWLFANKSCNFYSSSWSKAFLSHGFSKGAFVSPRGLSCRQCLIQVLWFLAVVHHSSAIFTTRPFDFCPWLNLAMSCNFCSSSSSSSSLQFSLSWPSSSSSLSYFPSPPPTFSHWGFYFLMTTISTSARWWNW